MLSHNIFDTRLITIPCNMAFMKIVLIYSHSNSYHHLTSRIKVGCEVLGASHSTCSVSRVDAIERDLHGFHTFDESDSSILTPYKKHEENNCTASNLSISSEKRKHHQKSSSKEYDAPQHQFYEDIDSSVDRDDARACSDTRSSLDAAVQNDFVTENITKGSTVNIIETTNDDKNDSMNCDNNDDNDNKCMINASYTRPKKKIDSTDFTANGIILPLNISNNDNVVNIKFNDTKTKIDGILVGQYTDDDDKTGDNNHNNCNKKNINSDNKCFSSRKKCIRSKSYYDNNNDDDNDDDDDGWKSMPSSHDFTATALESMMNKENTTSKVIKKKKTEKIRNKTSAENDNRSQKRIKNIYFDEKTYDLYTDGTHSKVLAYRFERVLLVETFKENAGN